MAKEKKLDMRIISNASLSMMNEIIKLINMKGGEYSYGEMSLLVDRDPHHQVNNAIRLGLLKKEGQIVKLTDLGNKYVSSNDGEKKEILKNNIVKIKIFDVLITKLQLKGKLTRKQIADILKSITEKEYTEGSLRAIVNVLGKWLVDLNFAFKEKDGSLKWKGRG